MTQADIATVFVPLMSVVTNPRFALWCGRGMSGTVIAFMLLDSTDQACRRFYLVSETMGQLGFFATPELARGLGPLGWSVRCFMPGRAPPSSVRSAHRLFRRRHGHASARRKPVVQPPALRFYLGLMAWGGLFLRDPRLRAFLLPFSNK